VNRNKQVLITGALGFVGTNLCEYFNAKSGYAVTGCDDLSFGKKENKVNGVEYHIKSFENYSSLELSRFDIVIHAATCNIIFAQSNPKHTVMVNDVATAELFSRIAPGAKIVYLSTASVYGNQAEQPISEEAEISLTNVYAMTKYAAELHLRKVHHNFTILRLSNVYGPHQSPENPYCGVIGKIMECMSVGNDFKVYGDGAATRDYTYVDDVCRAVEASIQSPYSKGMTFNVATGLEHNIIQLTRFCRHIEGAKNFELQHIEPRLIDNVRRRCLDPSRARQFIGWQPKTALYDGLVETFKWHKELVA